MSKKDRGLPDDFDSRESKESKGNDAGGEQDFTAITPEQVSGSFSDLIDDLRGKMTSGGLANKLRAPFSGTDAGKDASSSDELSTDEDASSDSSDAEIVSAEPDVDSDTYVHPKLSKGLEEFRASLDERFPNVGSSESAFAKAQADEEPSVHEADEVPDSPDTAGEHKDMSQFISRLGSRFRHSFKASSPEAASDISNDAEESEAVDVPDAQPDASGDNPIDEGASSDPDAVTSEAEGKDEKSFIEITAARIAEASAKRQEARRERREARRLAVEAREEAARSAELAPEETGWGEVDSANPNDDGSHDAVRDSDVAETEVLAKTGSDFDDVIIPPPPKSVRRLGDTDSLKAAGSERSSKVKFTRKGAPIVKLSSGSSALKNSMRSVRSTVDALNAGETIDPTKPTIALFAVIVLAATIISASTLFGTRTVSAGSAFFDSHPTATVEETEATSEADQEVNAAPSATAPKVASVDVISYNDDDGDHPENSPNLFDGDQGTRWQSRYYAQAELPEGNRIRLVIHLAEESTVSAVTFYGPIDGGQVDLRVNDGSDPFGTAVLTSSKMAGTTTLTPSEAVVGNTVTLDFVALPTDDEGRFRVKIDELALK